MLSSISSSMFLISRACSIVCCASRTSMPSFCSSSIIGTSTTSTPSGMSATPSASSSALISLAALAKQLAVAADRAAQAEQAGLAVVLAQPRRVEAMVLGGRAEVPDVRVAVAGEQRVARQLVARPFADHGAGGVADVVLVEAQQRAQPGVARAPRACAPAGSRAGGGNSRAPRSRPACGPAPAAAGPSRDADRCRRAG